MSIGVRLSTFVLFLIVVSFLALLLPTVGRQGVGWDEQTDLQIASEYASSLDGLVHGSRIDLINTRLPMYSVGLLFRLTGTINRDLARFASCAASVLTLLAVAVFCRRELDPTKGLLACGILATSPYFLAFSAAALTEGDVFITCAIAWSMVGLAWLRESPSWSRAAVAGTLLGLAASSKISGVAMMIPALITVATLRADALRPGPPTAPRSETAGAGFPLVVAGLFGLWLAVSAIVSRVVFPIDPASLPDLATRASSRWLAVLMLWLGILGWTWANRSRSSTRFGLATVMSLIAVLTFFVVPPVHTTNPSILGQLVREVISARSESDVSWVAEAVGHHFLVILFKPSLLVGAGLWLSAGLAVLRARSRIELRLPVLTLVCYGGFLATLPWAQTFYMMPLFPIMAILAADALVELYRSHRSAALAFAVAAIALLALDLVRCYPDFNLNGYQWLGERQWAGRSTLGYRAIAQVRSDGAAQILRWANDHVEPGETVVAFINPPHVIRTITPDPAFRLIDALRDPASIEQADYVLTQLNAELRHGHGSDNPTGDSIYSYPYDRPLLEEHFEKVFSVKRAFDVEVAAVWRRR